MCGITGIWNKNDQHVEENEIRSLTRLMQHRGPDAEGIWVNNNLALGHNRLKILDLSDQANQPYSDGKDVLVFNGEIFNYLKLRQELSDKYNFKTNSDTEVLFRALQTWSHNVFEKIEGQFAFAFYNQQKRTIMLARDHVGICPLYTYETENRLIFSSEIKPILELAKQRLNPQGVADYFGYRFNIQNGETLFGDIKRFTPGSYCIFDLALKKSVNNQFWRLTFKNDNFNLNETQDRFNEILDQEIQSQSIADVPVGLYLSGGIDSGALLQGFSKITSSIHSFTLRFSENDQDVKRVDSLKKKIPFKKNFIDFGLNVIEDIEKAVESLEEPFGDLIIVANYLLAQNASKQLKVVLSGEGGDEAFMGYDHQRAFLKMDSFAHNDVIRSLGGLLLKLCPPSLLGLIQQYPGRFEADEKRRIQNVFGLLSEPSEAYINLVSLFDKRDLQLLFSDRFKSNSAVAPDYQTIRNIFLNEPNVWKAVMRTEIEQLTLIVNLLKQDRFAMKFSMEGRVPFVSKNILEFAASLPYDQLVSKVNKQHLINYSGSKPIKKLAFSVFASPKYLKTLSFLMDKYVTRDSIFECGVLSWPYVQEIRGRMLRGNIIIVKRAMCILIFMIWWKCFRSYLRI